jgi:polyhydroxybutyrate depolymerase
VYAFVLDVMTLDIDPSKVHVTGFSQGGQMTFAMVCRYPEIWASAAPAAAAGGDCFVGGAPPATRVPMLQIHGTADGLVPFSAATSQRDGVIAAWGLGAGTAVGSGTGWSRTRYENAGGDAFEFLQHDYTAGGLLGGHCYPGSTDPGGLPNQLFSFKCNAPNDFVYGQVVMDYFLATPKS